MKGFVPTPFQKAVQFQACNKLVSLTLVGNLCAWQFMKQTV
jgi:hypothetical protein